MLASPIAQESRSSWEREGRKKSSLDDPTAGVSMLDQALDEMEDEGEDGEEEREEVARNVGSKSRAHMEPRSWTQDTYGALLAG